MKNLTRDTKLSLYEAVEHIASEFERNKQFKMSQSVVRPFNNKLVFKNENLTKKGLIVEIKLHDVGCSEHYNTLIVSFHNVETQTTSMTTSFSLMKPKYRTSNEGRADLAGGYYWSHDKSFYNYVPDFQLMINDIVDYITFSLS